MAIDVYEVVTKLIGNIDPVGETNADERSFENLKAITTLVDKLLTDIADVERYNVRRQEYSMKRAGDYAAKFLTEVKAGE